MAIIRRIYDNWSMNKLRARMIALNVGFSVAPLLLLGLAYNQLLLGTIQKHNEEKIDMLFNQVNSKLEEHFETLSQFSRAMFLNISFQTTMQKRDPAKEPSNRDVAEYLQSYQRINDYLRGVELLDYNGVSYSSNTYLLNRDMRAFIYGIAPEKLADGGVVYSGAFREDGNVANVYLAVRLVRSVLPEHYLQPLGIGVVVVDRRHLSWMINDNALASGSELYLVDEQDVIIAATRPEQEGQPFRQTADLEGRPYLLVKERTMQQTGWRLYALTDTEKQVRRADVFKYSTFVVGIALFVFVTFATFLFNYKLTLPIKKLADAFRRAATGDFTIKLRFRDHNEITAIGDKFNDMIRQIDKLTQTHLGTQQLLFQNELEKRQYQLNGLLTQINSHFLYNTLHSIRGMAMKNSVVAMRDTIDHLVSYLKYNSSLEEYVTIADELRHLETYTAIQKARFGERFKVSYRLDERLAAEHILKFTLQPIVENAIFHGLEPKRGKGFISIAARREKDRVVMKIFDNGIGMEADKVRDLSASIAAARPGSDTGSERRGIGLNNIHSRMQIYYGPDCGIEVKSWPQIGTVVILRFPILSEGGDA